jgi:anti-sigma regulatory factor (Ser/Thr protein kinase)
MNKNNNVNAHNREENHLLYLNLTSFLCLIYGNKYTYGKRVPHRREGENVPEVKAIKVKSDLKEIERIRDFLKKALAGFSLSEESFYMIELSLMEICVNIVRYAYPKETGDISLKVWFQEGDIYFEIRDWGIPFDPREIKDPDVQRMVHTGEIGGLGIFLCRRLMDGFDYKRENNQNVLTMHKHIDESECSESV